MRALAPVDILSSGSADELRDPQRLVIDPISQFLFWSDPGHEAVMRSSLAGSNVVKILPMAHPSGIALDTARKVLYAVQRARGASLIASTYDGFTQKHVTPFSLFEPAALSVDSADGSVMIVEKDTYEPGCDPLGGGGVGSINCRMRNLGQISRVSCNRPVSRTRHRHPPLPPPPDPPLPHPYPPHPTPLTPTRTRHRRTPAPFECCCYDGDDAESDSLELANDRLGCELLNCEEGEQTSDPPLLQTMLLEIGGFVDYGAQTVSWGDPTHVVAAPAARSWHDPSLVTYGTCVPGCGRPTGSDACQQCFGGRQVSYPFFSHVSYPFLPHVSYPISPICLLPIPPYMLHSLSMSAFFVCFAATALGTGSASSAPPASLGVAGT